MHVHHCVVVSDSLSLIVYSSTASFAISEMFGLVEGSKEKLNIQEYSIAQTSLEQIFNQFAAQQEEEKGPAVGLAPRNI